MTLRAHWILILVLFASPDLPPAAKEARSVLEQLLAAAASGVGIEKLTAHSTKEKCLSAGDELKRQLKEAFGKTVVAATACVQEE